MPTHNSNLDQTALNPNDWIPGYELLASIGSGGFGVVFRARQLVLDRIVAVKLIRFDKAVTPELAARFGAEAVTLGKLHHPNIVQIYDYGQHGGRLFLTMEYLEGEDLAQRLSRNQAINESTSWAIARQTAAALAHAAISGVIHRDIKPANLFLVPPPTGIGWPRDVPCVKVMDFGLALTKHAADDDDVRLTHTNATPGTPLYMAPEQCRKTSDLDHRADIYALGATVFHTLMGRPPFPGPTTWDLMLQKLDHRLQFDAKLSPESVDLLAAMMAPEPKNRIGNYDELLARIERLPVVQGLDLWRRAGTNQAGRPTLRLRTGRLIRQRWGWLTAASVLGVAGAGLGLGLWGDRRPDARAEAASVQYHSDGPPIALFEGKSSSMSAWLPPASGGRWSTETDDEHLPVLAGTGFTRRAFTAVEKYRITIGLDIHQATAAEVHFAIPVTAPEKERRFVLRVTRAEGAVFGTREGDKGTFHPEASPLPFPSSWLDEGRRPYLEVKFERAGGQWTAWFHGREVGQASDDGQPKLPEFRIGTEGGKVRIAEAFFRKLKKE
jgi:serine/threonine protein kinase